MGQALHRVYYQPRIHFVVWLGRQYLLEMWAKLEMGYCGFRPRSRPTPPSHPPPSPPPTPTPFGSPDTPPPPGFSEDPHVYTCPHHGGHQPDVCFLW
ncbi:hypothetical protein Hamer_G012544 [Homarus americanus]|uniref:Uncharacterized protein n=1 Tax=Homarus americanus TaxID=6706 RepID=A0A8J5K6M7_HOMAM|nr:hypothetical protein Hamer_G012544 [Homarus americanus]